MKYKVEVVMPKNPQKLLDKFADVLAEEVAKALTREELIIYAKRLEEQIRSQMIWEKSKYIGRAILLWKIIKEHYYIF